MKLTDERFKPLHTGEIYYPSEEKMFIKQLHCINLCHRYNRLPSGVIGYALRSRLMKKMFAEMGDNCYIEPPFYANFGGKNVHLGNDVYANFHLTCVDDTHIYIGDHTMIGPNVTLVTAAHPISPTLREKVYQYNLPVRIGKNCWLGANVTVLPGVTIGDNTVVGAGSVVTKDLPSNVVAVGVPARVLREITENDDKFYRKNKEIPKEFFE